MARLESVLNGRALRSECTSSKDELATRRHERDVEMVVLAADDIDGVSLAAGCEADEPTPAPVLVLDCHGAEDTQRALAAGAFLTARDDASDVELGSLVAACQRERELTRACQRVGEELRHEAALAMKDDLTAAHNRRFFDRFLAEALERSRATQRPASLIFLDIDDLRTVNEEHGHDTGSSVLQQAAARAIEAARSEDVVVRYGGDEFCIVLPETGWRGAVELARRIRESFAASAFEVEDGDGVSLTASFGVASHPEHATDPAGLVRAADQAMYQVKAEAKDGIHVAGGEQA
ncbi:MAG: GGDEF domain-containing protein [Acidobacteriota bacterium]